MQDLTAIIISAIGAFMTFLGICVTTFFSYRTKVHTAQVNDAVNNVHQAGGKRIYDLVLENRDDIRLVKNQSNELLDWKRSYDNSPWRDGNKVNEWLDDHKEVLDPESK